MDGFLQYIPHRPPFLFVDRVVEATEDRIKTEKDVKQEEPFFEGHYPGRPIMPGVLILESVFQTGAILMGKGVESLENRIPVITRVNQAKFKHAVFPGDVMEIEVTVKERVEPACFLSGRVIVNSKTAVTVDFAVMLVEDIQ
ncbi:MAG: 3-hydroxyacyl-[acyl-carrier-protein] dehydratase FabZ [Nitrospinaceae bacterium]|nr:MAG: 3-hydroxyacyl-[acyl-carrier-protein] dehydratase FabZ [Nitrospinaceae bacterium]